VGAGEVRVDPRRSASDRLACDDGAVSVIEIETFLLADGVDEAAYVSADAVVQTDVVYQQRGLARRTTARGGADGRWAVITIWYDIETRDTAAEAAVGHEAERVRRSLMAPNSRRVESYESLPG
jgi:hypothetical protein